MGANLMVTRGLTGRTMLGPGLAGQAHRRRERDQAGAAHRPIPGLLVGGQHCPLRARNAGRDGAEQLDACGVSSRGRGPARRPSEYGSFLPLRPESRRSAFVLFRACAPSTFLPKRAPPSGVMGWILRTSTWPTLLRTWLALGWWPHSRGSVPS